ncbi:hypothetical protein HYG81_21515 (plasmid) [Natrinema zhouii]|uniref:hypothetical protein n=1 Tax=Natrinema zhouii TaxID=1710539 RepID=UPI001CFFC4AE|nr:hypothetical protein [Natrinema zhouii]UHQ98156.1 hypothetical protein HYG81_21515 [Natrinema zhouii]
MTHENYPHEEDVQADRQTNESNDFTIPNEDQLSAIAHTLLEEVEDDDEVPLAISDDIVIVPKDELAHGLAESFQTLFKLVENDEF